MQNPAQANWVQAVTKKLPKDPQTTLDPAMVTDPHVKKAKWQVNFFYNSILYWLANVTYFT